MFLPMLPQNQGKWFRSEVMNFGGGGTLVPRLSFLDPARQFDAPEIAYWIVQFTGTVGAVAGGAKGRDAAKLFAKIIQRDSEDFWNVSGTGSRLIEQVELGSKQKDPADLASGTSNASYNYHLRIIHNPNKALRPRDYRVPLSNMLEGGSFQIQCAAGVPTGWNAAQNDWKVTLWAYIIDGRTKELKTRVKTWEHVVNQQEFFYPVNGLLRMALLTSDLTSTAGYTDLSSYTTMYSQSLDFVPALDTSMLYDDYQFNSEALGSNDEFSLAAPGGIAIVAPKKQKKIGEMPELTNLHLNLLAAAPTGGRLLTQSVQDRNSASSAMQLGLPSSDAVLAAAKARGYTVIGDGDSPQSSSFIPRLARKLPMRIGG